MKTIIYGIGRSFFDFFSDKKFIQNGLIENEIEVVGFADGNENAWGLEIIYNEHKFLVKNIDEFEKSEIDRIIITTKLYFDEIRKRLIEKGYMAEKIVVIDRFIEEYLDEIYCIERFAHKEGIEIGGATKLFENIYNRCSACDNVNFSINTVWVENNTGNFMFENKVLGNNLIADATDMHQIESDKYDFALSSNNLEHIANPLKALKEFCRIVKKGGSILVLVPMKENCFDHNREYTTFEHILQDYTNGVTEDDLSHLPEIIEKHDYSMDIACGGKEKFIERAMKNIENRCLHHHVFDEKCLRTAFEYAGLRVIDCSSTFGNWIIIGEKK